MAHMTLVEFLLERIDEEERAAHQCAKVFPAPWDLYDRGHSAKVSAAEPNFLSVVEIDQDVAPGSDWLGDCLTHVARHDPARTLAECASKRLTIQTCQFWIEHQEPNRHTGADYILGATELAESVLLTLADAYKDHQDWREEW